MKLASLLSAGAVVAAAIVAAAPASAVTYVTSLGTISTVPTYLSPGVQVAPVGGDNTVLSLYQFTLAVDSVLNAGSFTSTAPNAVQFSNVVLYQGTFDGTSGSTGTVPVVIDPIASMPTNPTGSTSIAYNPVQLANGSYTIAVSGTTATTQAIGSSISFTAAPSVPEAATWAMMVVGFGVAGAGMRSSRRKNVLA